MAKITFYGKPNCVNNNKQKKLLQAAGHVIDDQDILSQAWQPDQLREYFGNAPVCEWFNMTAPAIKQKTIAVDTISAMDALTAMMNDPLLIRRPLMAINGHKICGFRHDELDELVGLSPEAGHEAEMDALKSENITTCPFLQTTTNCDQQQK